MEYRIDAVVLEELQVQGLVVDGLAEMNSEIFTNAVKFNDDLQKTGGLSADDASKAMEFARLGLWEVSESVIATELDSHWLTSGQMEAVRSLTDRQFNHQWKFNRALAEASAEWKLLPDTTVNKLTNKEMKKKLKYLGRLFKVDTTSTNPEKENI